MNRKTLAIVDYGFGNHSSVLHTFQSLGHRCRVTNNREILVAADLLVLPGVGAFPSAMSALHKLGLVTFLCELAGQGKPLIGLCLGMQLLADKSLENGLTEGLGLIPGTVRALPSMEWHIGWNTLENVLPDPMMASSGGESFYFNHSYFFDVPAAYQAAVSHTNECSFTVAVRRGNVLGLQFHPEKSQAAGKQLLLSAVEGLCDA